MLKYLQSWQIVGQAVEEILKDYPRLRLTHGRKVFSCKTFRLVAIHDDFSMLYICILYIYLTVII